ncbi:phage integrase family protein [Kribbella sp. VKM Ac-2568]|nr:phage integrase family protein [Kribbella sp. VKM Ac-2568]
MRFRDLRHSCVTLLLLLGVPPHIVQAIVGHADVHVTMTIYAHASLEDQRRALDKLAVLLAGWGRSWTCCWTSGRIGGSQTEKPQVRRVVRGGLEPPTFRFSGGRSTS